jgi:hypothetical protein
MDTSEFKMAFSTDFHEFVEWFNDTHKTDFDAVQTEITSHKAESATEEKLGHVKVDGETILINEDGVISGAALTNKNLLHNWDFTNPVNQRGQSSYTVSSNSAAVFTIDRWKIISNDNGQESTLTVGDGFITLASTNTRPVLRQFTEVTTKEETVFTFSVNVTAITGVASIHLRDTAYATYAVKWDISSPGLYSITSTVPAGKTLVVQINTNANGQSISINKVKLELGSISTLANDPPAVYSEQLAFCGPVVDTIAPTSYIGQDGQWQVY